MRNVSENVSSRPTDLFSRICWKDSACSLFPATTTKLFSQSLSFHTLCSCLDFISTSNFSNFWRSSFQQVSTHGFRSWDDIITQKKNCSSFKILYNCTETPPTLLTSFLIEWNLYVTGNNHLVTSNLKDVNLQGKWTLEVFLNIQTGRVIPTKPNDFFFTARVSQVNMKTMKKSFEQRFELHVAECLIVHVLSSSYIVCSLQLQY